MSHFMKFPHVIQNGGPRSKRCSSFVEKRKQCYSRNEANPNHKLSNYVGVLFDSNLKSLKSHPLKSYPLKVKYTLWGG